MTYAEPHPGRNHAVRLPAGGAETATLAAALSHLLARDDEPPARWRARSFAEAVEAVRAAQADATTWRAGPPAEARADAAPGFHEAVARLARNPADVALAIGRLELAGRRKLPAWPDLMRRGLPAQPSDLDRALWFG